MLFCIGYVSFGELDFSGFAGGLDLWGNHLSAKPHRIGIDTSFPAFVYPYLRSRFKITDGPLMGYRNHF